MCVYVARPWSSTLLRIDTHVHTRTHVQWIVGEIYIFVYDYDIFLPRSRGTKSPWPREAIADDVSLTLSETQLLGNDFMRKSDKYPENIPDGQGYESAQ